MRRVGLKDDDKKVKAADGSRPTSKRLVVVGLTLALLMYVSYTVGTWNATVVILPPTELPGAWPPSCPLASATRGPCCMLCFVRGSA